jgi:hypothetical protein
MGKEIFNETISTYPVQITFMSTYIFRVWLLFIAGLGVCNASYADDFSIDNRVYSGEKKEPASHSLTVFHKAIVYDFLKDPAETIIFDKAAGRFSILDESRRIRTELSTAEVDSFTRKLKELAGKQQDPLTQFFSDPEFQEHFDSSRGELTLASPMVEYKSIITAAENPAVAAQYREFSDWYVKLNSVLTPGSRPPFSRLKLNEAIAAHEAIARQVTLTVTLPKQENSRPTSIRSEHILSLTLTPADLEHIKHARQSMTDYKLVSFDTYFKAKR